MRTIACVISFCLLVYLSLDFFDGTGDDINDKSKVDEVVLNIPISISKDSLAIEKKWQDALKRENLVKETEENDAKGKDYSLTLGNSNYQLLGIFQEQNSQFVLLKDEKGKLIKLANSNELPGGYTLVEISSNLIAFAVNNERLEYKLFEPKSHAKN